MKKILILGAMFSMFAFGDSKLTTHLGSEVSHFGKLDYYCIADVVYISYNTGENYRIKMLQPLIEKNDYSNRLYHNHELVPYWRCDEFLKRNKLQKD